MARWNLANVLNVGAGARRLWQFSTSGNFPLAREYTAQNGEPFPGNLVAKTWRSMWQPRLNIAWLPADKIFIRVIQVPAADPAETVAMVELQLEKLSPLPVAQIVWTLEVLPKSDENLQNVIVVIVPRNLVEEFLGQLEGQDYLADRLELPLLDQLLSTNISEDGVWVYASENPESPFLVAWWYGGILRNVTLLAGVSHTEPERLRDQLSQIAWAGELEGWLTSAPKWHLVADGETAAKWEPLLSQWAEQPIQVVPATPEKDLAALSARRAVRADRGVGLVPSDFTTRYHQQYIDRLWMRGLGAVVMIYIVGVVIYFSAVQVLAYKHNSLKKEMTGLSQQYTNTIQLKERVRVLEDQANLKYAALDCWKAASDLLPQELTLTSLTFQTGKKLSLSGTVSQESSSKVTDYYEAMSKVLINGEPMKLSPMNLTGTRPGAGGAQVSWSFVCEVQMRDYAPLTKKKGGAK
jgi:hypothetical protein